MKKGRKFVGLKYIIYIKNKLYSGHTTSIYYNKDILKLNQ